MAKEETLKDLRGDCPCSGLPYCPYEALFHSHPDKLFRQHKCVEILKWNRQLPNTDEGWERAYDIWFKEGYAGAFAGVYNKDTELEHKQLFRAIEAELTRVGGAYEDDAARLAKQAGELADKRLNKVLETTAVKTETNAGRTEVVVPVTNQGLEVKVG